MSTVMGSRLDSWIRREGRVKEKSSPRAPHVKEAVQTRTFTNWINVHLKKHDPTWQVTNLFAEIQDGKILMALLEELSGCNLLDRFRPFPHRIFRLNNISKVLNFLEDRNVRLINIDANDIADGNPSVVLRLIWNIIVHYQIKEFTRSMRRFSSSLSLVSLYCGSDSSGRSSPVSPGDEMSGSLSNLQKYRGTSIKTLLSWAQNCTAKYGVEIQDFGQSWKSGLAFLALVKVFCPECVDMRKAVTSDPRGNMQTAFSLAQDRLGIPPLLAPEDAAVCSPDEQSVITYVAQFLERFPADEESWASDSSRCSSWSESSFQLLSRNLVQTHSWRSGQDEESGGCPGEDVYGLPALDPDEEEAYSYIIQLDLKETSPDSDSNLNSHHQCGEMVTNAEGHGGDEGPGDQLCRDLLVADESVQDFDQNHPSGEDNRCSTETSEEDCALGMMEKNSACVDNSSPPEEAKKITKDCWKNETICDDDVRDYHISCETRDEKSLPKSERVENLPVTFGSIAPDGEEMHILLFLWMFIYCIFLCPHLDIFSLLS